MKESKNNFFIRIYQVYYGVYPKSLCGFFWKTILAIAMVLTSPISLFLLATKHFKDNNAILEFSIVDKVIIFFSISLILDSKNHKINWGDLWWNYLLVIGVIVFILISISFIAKLEDKISNKPVVEKKPNIMLESFKSIYSKVCPIIEIED